MSNIDFITKPRYEQINYVKEQLKTIRRANYDIMKNMEQAQLTERDKQILQTDKEFKTVEKKIIEFLQKFNIQLETLLAIKKDNSPEERYKKVVFSDDLSKWNKEVQLWSDSYEKPYLIKRKQDFVDKENDIISSAEYSQLENEWKAYEQEVANATPVFENAMRQYEVDKEAFDQGKTTTKPKKPLIHMYFKDKKNKKPKETIDKFIDNEMAVFSTKYPSFEDYMKLNKYPKMPIKPSKPTSKPITAYFESSLIQNEYSKYANTIIYTYGEFKTYIDELLSLIPIMNSVIINDIIKEYDILIKTFNEFLKTMYKKPPYTYRNTAISLEPTSGASGNIFNSKKFTIIETNDVIVKKLMDIVGDNGMLTDIIKIVKGQKQLN